MLFNVNFFKITNADNKCFIHSQTIPYNHVKMKALSNVIMFYMFFPCIMYAIHKESQKGCILVNKKKCCVISRNDLSSVNCFASSSFSNVGLCVKSIL